VADEMLREHVTWALARVTGEPPST